MCPKATPVLLRSRKDDGRRASIADQRGRGESTRTRSAGSRRLIDSVYRGPASSCLSARSLARRRGAGCSCPRLVAPFVSRRFFALRFFHFSRAGTPLCVIRRFERARWPSYRDPRVFNCSTWRDWVGVWADSGGSVESLKGWGVFGWVGELFFMMFDREVLTLVI